VRHTHHDELVARGRPPSSTSNFQRLRRLCSDLDRSAPIQISATRNANVAAARAVTRSGLSSGSHLLCG
jgi:hypothetical protein